LVTDEQLKEADDYFNRGYLGFAAGYLTYDQAYDLFKKYPEIIAVTLYASDKARYLKYFTYLTKAKYKSSRKSPCSRLPAWEYD
jgi:hypothetical protein